MMKGTPSIELH